MNRLGYDRRGVLKGIAATTLAAAGVARGAEERDQVSTFVLVHAAWHGGWCWKKVTPLLRATGHQVFTPTLTGLGERAHLAHPLIGLESHVQDIVNVLVFEDLTDVILVGHSNSGTLITAIADRVPERIAHLIYIDAFVPRDGEATVDLITFPRQAWEARVHDDGYGWLIPSLQPVPWDDFARDVWRITDPTDRKWLVERLRPTPFKTFTDPVRLSNPAAEKIPRTYIRCLQHASKTFDRYAEMAGHTAGWRLRALPTGHEPFVTTPHELTELLLEPTRSS